jgi:hypothetical protein
MAFTGALSEAIEPVDHVQSVRSYKFVFFIFWGDWSSAEGDKSAGDWILVLYSRIVCCFLHWFLLLWFKSISSWFKTWSFFLQGGEHSRTAFASCSPSCPRLDLVSPQFNTDFFAAQIWFPIPVKFNSCHLIQNPSFGDCTARRPSPLKVRFWECHKVSELS